MLKERDQEWSFFERATVLAELSKDCTPAERDLIRGEILRASSIFVGLLKNMPKGSVYLFTAGKYSYFALDYSAAMKDLYIVVVD